MSQWHDWLDCVARNIRCEMETLIEAWQFSHDSSAEVRIRGFVQLSYLHWPVSQKPRHEYEAIHFLNVIKPETNKKQTRVTKVRPKKLIRNKSTVHFSLPTSSFEKKVEFHPIPAAENPALNRYGLTSSSQESPPCICKSPFKAVCYYCFGYYFVLPPRPLFLPCLLYAWSMIWYIRRQK